MTYVVTVYNPTTGDHVSTAADIKVMARSHPREKRI